MFRRGNAAAEILKSVWDEKRPLDEALARNKAMNQLAERDRGFARLMVMTCLRRRGQIDALLAGFLAKPLVGKTTDVMHCLRLGVAQLIWLKTPPHAAVHAMVETVQAMGHEQMKGLVNAVLKRVAKEGEAVVAAQDEVKLNIPEWIYTGWQKSYGEAGARAMGLALQQEPPLDITVKNDAEGWAYKLGGIVLPTGSVRIMQAGRVDQLEGFAEGEWWVQDAAAALPVKLLGDVRGQEVLDLCAAPGGKTAQLAAAGAVVTALDKSPRRLMLLDENMHRLGFTVETVESDLLKYRPQKQFDAILLDAPCTATGTLRRHPEVIWNKTPDDVPELAALQRRLLNRVVKWLKPGGRLVYCVCSLQPKEGESQAVDFQPEEGKFAILPAPDSWKELGIVTDKGELRARPDKMNEMGGMDGFYAVCWQHLSNN